MTPRDLSRRDFVAASLAVGLGVAARHSSDTQLAITESNVEIKTPDGTCDALFVHPTTGAYPGVLVWPDSLGLRPALRELGRRCAAEGYAVLVPNHLYRMAKAPVFDSTFNYANTADRDRYGRMVAPFLVPGAAERDAVAYIAFLDARRQVDKAKKIGTHGYCLGGPYVLKTAAVLPDRVGAGASFHGGFLVTDKPDSPHLLGPRIKAQLYFAIASDDDKREPDAKDKLIAALKSANVRAELELFPDALHGFTVPDSKNVYNKPEADRAWSKLVALYKAAL